MMSRPAASRAPEAACALILLLLAAASAGALPGDRDRSDLLVRQGMALLSSGERAEAEAYARRALEFDSASSDAHVLLAELWSTQGRYDRAASEQRQALDAATFRIRKEADSRRSLAEALLRMRQDAEALAVLAGIAPGEEDESALLLAAGARLRLGDLPEARRLAREATRRFPDSPGPYVLLARIERADNRFGDARLLLETARAHLPGDPAILLALLEGARSTEGQAFAAEYFANGTGGGGTGPETDAPAAVSAMRVDPAKAGDYLERFLAAGGPRDANLVTRARELLADKPELLGRLEAALEGWSGERLLDRDADSIAECRFLLQNGALVEWGVDEDQDGLEEALVSVAGGVPVTATLRDWPSRSELQSEVDETVLVEYAEYPWVRTAVYLVAGRRRVYELVPGACRFRLFITGEPVLEPLPLVGLTFLPEQEVRAASSVYRDYLLPGGQLVVSGELLDGELLRLRADADGDGREDHIVLWQDGLPASGKRDLDDDGVFETRESYREGALARVEVDADGDGKPEYIRSFDREGTESWDLDSDGIMDMDRSRALVGELRSSLGISAGAGR